MEPMLDLTLKLGLPVSDRTVETSLSLHTPTTINSHQGINAGSGGGGGDRLRFLGGEKAISDHDEGVRNNVNVNVMFSNYILRRFSGAGNLASPTNSAPASSPAPINLNECVMFDVPSRRAHRNSSIANANANPYANANANPYANANANASFVGKRRGCGGGRYGFSERLKRCTNIKCNTDETPMWRKGPLGPKSLCNACGIKFRKEMERRARDNN